jgi:hypothetical protein
VEYELNELRDHLRSLLLVNQRITTDTADYVITVVAHIEKYATIVVVVDSDPLAQGY